MLAPELSQPGVNKKQWPAYRAVLKPKQEMKTIVLLISLICLSSCTFLKDNSDQTASTPTLKEQQRDARQEEEFARSLPKPQ